MRLLGLLLLVLSCNALAQYEGPAVEACRAFAKREAARDGGKPEDVVILKDAALIIERYGRKLGSQHVSSILTGNGAVVLPGTPTAELSFICLLADEKRPLFFNWLPRQSVSALAQCTRSQELRGKSRECLEFLLRVAEQDLTMVYAQRFQEAHAAGENTLAAYRKANDEWKEYRDAECARRREIAPKGVDPEDYQLACFVELMRQRGRDMR
jgi:uncharacterized protein YecT (DUF1311 family)